MGGQRDIRSEYGAVVAEFAVGLPVVMLTLAFALGGVAVGGLQIRAQDAAADAARGLARGDTATTVTARLATQIPGARWTTWHSEGLDCVQVRVPASGSPATLGLDVVASSCALAGAA